MARPLAVASVFTCVKGKICRFCGGLRAFKRNVNAKSYYIVDYIGKFIKQEESSIQFHEVVISLFGLISVDGI